MENTMNPAPLLDVAIEAACDDPAFGLAVREKYQAQKTELDEWKKAAADSLTTIEYLERRGDKKSSRIKKLEADLKKLDEQPINARPYFSQLHIHEWTDRLGHKTPGIAVRKGRWFAAHLTRDEAIQLANKLADLVERLDQDHDTY